MSRLSARGCGSCGQEHLGEYLAGEARESDEEGGVSLWMARRADGKGEG